MGKCLTLVKEIRLAFKNKNVLSIAFQLPGGIGDLLIPANHLWHFKNFINNDNVKIDIYISPKMKFAGTIFEEKTYINKLYYCDPDSSNKTYDVEIFLARIPVIQKISASSIKKFGTKLCEFLNIDKNFR